MSVAVGLLVSDMMLSGSMPLFALQAYCLLCYSSGLSIYSQIVVQ